MNQLVERSEVDNGSLRNWALANTEQFHEEYIVPYLNVAKNCKYDNNCFGEKFSLMSGFSLNLSPYYKLKLADGSRWLINTSDTDFINIDVDINGDKKPNVYGSDQFCFLITKRAITNSSVKVDGPGVYFFGHGLDKTALLNSCRAGSSGYTCGALIVLDGWKITY
jgi:hypothetical protein